MATEPAQDQNLIRDTIADLDYNLAQIDREIESLEARRTEVAARRDRWARQLNQMAGGGSAGRSGQRTPKGQNRATIKEFLASQRPSAMTIAQIADATTIGRSSVRTTLFGNRDIFKETNGGWTLNE